MADMRKRYLRQLEDELLEEEAEALFDEEDELPERPYEHRRIRADFGRMAYEDDPREANAVYDEGPHPKGAGSLVFLAILELLGIAAIIGWWIKWLG